MIAGDELALWLSDKRRQAETLAEIKAGGIRFRESAAMAELQRTLDRPAEGGAPAILAAAERFVDRLDDIEAQLRTMIRAALANPFYRPSLKLVTSPVHLGLLLLDHPSLSVLLAVTPPDALAAKRTGREGPASITFTGRRSLFKFVKGGGATLSFWEAPQIGEGFTASAGGRCRPVGRRTIEDGETIWLDGRRESFIIDHASSDIVYLQAVTPVGGAPLSVEYDADTLSFAGASSSDEINSRVQMVVSLLRLLDRADAAPVLRSAIADSPFFVRWHIMREFLALDAELAHSTLCAMAEADPHPEVRAAAAATLAAFFPESAALPVEEAEPCPA
jgi:hypothetical protein